jgi:hypothetical protein
MDMLGRPRCRYGSRVSGVTRSAWTEPSLAALLDLLPTNFVDTPAAGTEVMGGSLRMTDMAAVFEAVA